ncbi:MAG: hypothetical protein U5K38_13440 [Woeseiaceae bacterium]|nr:hypothetical protein [Woeseiaceae bacterium]
MDKRTPHLAAEFFYRNWQIDEMLRLGDRGSSISALRAVPLKIKYVPAEVVFLTRLVNLPLLRQGHRGFTFSAFPVVDTKDQSAVDQVAFLNRIVGFTLVAIGGIAGLPSALFLLLTLKINPRLPAEFF